MKKIIKKNLNLFLLKLKKIIKKNLNLFLLKFRRWYRFMLGIQVYKLGGLAGNYFVWSMVSKQMEEWIKINSINLMLLICFLLKIKMESLYREVSSLIMITMLLIKLEADLIGLFFTPVSFFNAQNIKISHGMKNTLMNLQNSILIK